MNDLARAILNKGIAISKTDTLYGVLGLASSKEVIQRIYKVKKRDLSKPLIVLISHINQLKDFGAILNPHIINTLKQYWPGPYTFILNVEDTKFFEYLHRGTKTIAFRLPDDEYLCSVIDVTGPLVAPSANIQGSTPAANISMAQEYFRDTVDYYDDRGTCVNTKPSHIFSFKDGEMMKVR